MIKTKTILFFLTVLFISLYSSNGFSQEKNAEEENVIEEEIVIKNTDEDIIDGKVNFISQDSLRFLNDKSDLGEYRKFKPGFKEEYKNLPEFDYDQDIPEISYWQRLKYAILEWLFDKIGRPISTGLGTNTFWIIARLVGIGCIGFIVYYLVRAFIRKDLYWLIRKNSQKIEAFEQLTEEDIKSTNFEQIIHGLVQEKRFRLAVRMYYLWLLQTLQAENKIKWNIQKTNSDYLYELKEENERNTFIYLSYLYDNIWYGEYDITEDDFYKAQKSFNKRLKNN